MKKLFEYLTLSASISAFIVVVCLSIQSCSNDYEVAFEAKEECSEMDEYLDCSESTLFSKQGQEIMGKVLQRVEDYLIIESDTCYLTISSAKDINISDFLFSMVKQSVANANTQYKAYLYFMENDKGIIIENPFDIKLPIITTRSNSESIWGANFRTTTTTLNDEEVTTVINAMRTVNGVTAFSGLINGKFTPNVASALISAYAFFTDAKFSSIQDEYARSGSTNGITLIEITTYSPTGMSCTMYNANINR